MLVAEESGLFDTVFGLPLHPLAVHAAVVLVPLAALGALAMALSPRLSRRYGGLVVVTGIAAFIASFVAKEAGEALALRVGQPGQHAQLGDVVPLLALLLALGIAAFWLVDRGIPGNRSRPWWLRLAAVALIVIAVLATVWAVRAGHTGAELVWQGRVRERVPARAIVSRTPPGSRYGQRAADASRQGVRVPRAPGHRPTH